MVSIKKQLHLNPYDYHKYLINEYVLKKPGDTRLLKELDRTKWKSDKDVIIQNMKFIWNTEDAPVSWEERLAKKYYDKLFREYCICDLSRFKENKIANRFRIEKEILSGKGQFVCGETGCQEEVRLKTWEVNFAYVEAGERKNALVKIRLCPSDSEKLNYHSKKREVKRLNRTKHKSRGSVEQSKNYEKEVTSKPLLNKSSSSTSLNEITDEVEAKSPEREGSIKMMRQPIDEDNLWKKNNEIDVKGRDEEFDDYLADLLL